MKECLEKKGFLPSRSAVMQILWKLGIPKVGYRGQYGISENVVAAVLDTLTGKPGNPHRGKQEK